MKLPAHLLKQHATGIHENEVVAQYEIGNYKNFVYLILDWSHKKAAIIDPQYDLSSLLASLQHYEFELVEILLTHTHWDHTAGVPEIIKKFPKIPIRVHLKDLHRLAHDIQNQAVIRHVQDGDRISVGSLEVQVIHTPGHSAGECCFFLECPAPNHEAYLWTGDTVFIGDCGRTDIETGSDVEMFESLQRLKKLSGKSIILPGHHYRPACASTLEQEIQHNPAFQCQNVAELIALP